MKSEFCDHELDQFITQKFMEELGTIPYTSNMANAWQVVEKMMHKYQCELKLDVFLGVSGPLWVVSFYSPAQCKRYEARARTAPLAICQAAQQAYLELAGGR
jgi:hypothetical protein